MTTSNQHSLWCLAMLIALMVDCRNGVRADPGDRADGKPAVDKLYPGLEVRLYPRSEQKQPAGAGGFVAPGELGEAFGNAFVTASVSPLKYDAGYNAVARGFLQVDKAGDYVFNANNFYDRNALYIDGKLVCPYRDGEQTEQKVTLS